MKQKKSCIKNIIIKIVSCVMVSFLVLTAHVIPKKENYIVHADTDVKINPFVWLMTYFGINMYTDAQEINDALYTAISVAYNTYQLSLQESQRVSIDDIINDIEWTPSQPNALRVSGWVFNALRGFADYLDNKVTTASEALEIGTFETVSEGSYSVVPANVTYNIGQWTKSNGTVNYVLFKSNGDVRTICFTKTSDPRLVFYYVSLSSFKTINTYNPDPNYQLGTPVSAASSTTYNGVTYYYNYNSIYIDNGNTPISNVPTYDYISNNNQRLTAAIEYTFGSSASDGGAVLNDIFALPEQAVLDDLIGAADPNQEVEIDLTDSDIAYSTAATLEDIIGLINDYVDARILDNEWAETVGKTIAQAQALENEITEVDYPNAITWEVPEIIDTPQIIPLITPECPDLSSCLISGVQEVSNTMNEIINIHPDTGNYVTAALYMGLVLLILGSTVL